MRGIWIWCVGNVSSFRVEDARKPNYNNNASLASSVGGPACRAVDQVTCWELVCSEPD